MTIDIGQNDDPIPMTDGATLCMEYPQTEKVRGLQRMDFELPKFMHCYEHNNGLLYLVVGYNNMESTSPEHPPMVEYVGENGNKWSKPLPTWNEKMTLSSRDFSWRDVPTRIVTHQRTGVEAVLYPNQRFRTHAKAFC